MDGVINMAVFDVMKEFFARSNIWLFESIVAIIPSSNDYQIETGQPVVVNRLMKVCRPTVPPPIPPQYLPMDPPQYLMLWSADGQYGTNESVNPDYSVPRNAVLLNAGVKCPIMRIRWNPMATEWWIVTVALGLSDPTDSQGLPKAPDWILDKYYDYICAGVRSRLMLQPGKGYSSPQGAAFNGRKFNEGVGLARTEVRDMFTYGAQRWTYPQGWNYRKPHVP